MLYAPGCRGAALLLLRSARKIFEERNWSRLVDTCVGLVIDIQDQRPRRVREQLGLHC